MYIYIYKYTYICIYIYVYISSLDAKPYIFTQGSEWVCRWRLIAPQISRIEIKNSSGARRRRCLASCCRTPRSVSLMMYCRVLFRTDWNTEHILAMKVKNKGILSMGSTHARTYTHRHARTYTHIHTHTYTYAYTLTYTTHTQHTHTQAQTSTRTRTQTHLHHTHTHTHIAHTHTHTQTHTHTHTCAVLDPWMPLQVGFLSVVVPHT